MLHIYFGEMNNSNYGPDWFKSNYNPEWLKDSFVQDMIKDVDKQPVEEIDRIKSGRVPSTRASPLVEWAL